MARVNDAIKALEEVMNELDSAIMEQTLLPANEQNLIELADHFVALDDFKKATTFLSNRLSATMDKLTSTGTLIPVEGRSAVVEKRYGKSRKSWSKGLHTIVPEKIIQKYTDPETGILEKPVHLVVADVLKCMGISYWKVTELKELGLNPDNYCVSSEGKVSFTVSKSNYDKTEEEEDIDDDF